MNLAVMVLVLFVGVCVVVFCAWKAIGAMGPAAPPLPPLPPLRDDDCDDGAGPFGTAPKENDSP